jgi:hypothetical protein
MVSRLVACFTLFCFFRRGIVYYMTMGLPLVPCIHFAFGCISFSFYLSPFPSQVVCALTLDRPLNRIDCGCVVGSIRIQYNKNTTYINHQ